MKVAILSSLYPPYSVGGTEKAVSLLAEALVTHGVEVVVISLHPGKTQTVDTCNGVRVYRMPINNLYLPWLGGSRPNPLLRLLWHLGDMWNWRAASRVGKVLRKERPDVLHTHSVSGFSVAVWEVARQLGIARVHTLYDHYLLCAKTTLYRNGSVCKTRCADCRALTCTRPPASKLVQSVTGLTDAILQEHLQCGLFPQARAEMARPIQLPVPRSAPRPDDTVTFGFIGRITQEKGVELLLEALAAMPDAPCQLKIAGKGPDDYIAGLQQRFPDPRIEWLGFTPSEAFYGMVDVVVVPSVWPEPMAYTCVEAMFAGKSVIASDIGGLREVALLVPQHKLFTAGDRAALTAAMEEAVQDSVSWKTNRVLADEVLASFSQANVTRQYERLYRASLSR